MPGRTGCRYWFVREGRMNASVWEWHSDSVSERDGSRYQGQGGSEDPGGDEWARGPDAMKHVTGSFLG